MPRSKYAGLARYLSGVPTPMWRARFSDIEKVLGFPLPESARQHRAWWSNNGSNNVMSKVWKTAGWETEQVDMSNQVLVFRRVSGGAAASPEKRPVERGPFGFSFGRLKGSVTFARDLAEPTGDEWNAERGRL